ncbi:hypothetical protein ALP10_05647 [Pseudomonas syringae pv. helianthi]|uniref:Uncharacterized protein n=1 Tax=Pseudomonas syringae pv. helianthi TaxID=251654 RepID=A0A3M6CUA2_9PSED|nr:hypothetical protein ALP10_05647 [Pseudomonas syringae pv. helianthi]
MLRLGWLAGGMTAFKVCLHRAQALRQVRGLDRYRLAGQGLKPLCKHFALRIVLIEVGLQNALRFGDCLGVYLRLPVQCRPLGLLQRQAQGQTHLRKALTCQYRTDVLVGVEIDTEVMGNLVPPLRPSALLGLVVGQPQQRLALVFVFGCQLVELNSLFTQSSQLQKQPGAVWLLDAAQRGKALGQLLASREGARIVLLTQNFVGALDQGLSTVDVLQCRKAQAGQTQQMLGFCQTPVLAARAQHGFKSLAEALLIALQLRHKTSTVCQLVGGRELCETCIQLLVILSQHQRLLGDVLDLAALLPCAVARLPSLQRRYRRCRAARPGIPGRCCGCRSARCVQVQAWMQAFSTPILRL